ncbi:hypothetical protein F4U94_20960 [Sphingobium limneticum]|jgi:hypothetical protein|uniref:hypothetical protein n=1 Tax=Sphingobium limneticum TaxID=1007511 RepID=UPI00123D5081|nr:hypothetical protein [Sphingobium limneticum]KAA9011294.1 hypothetical protein F4U94_20960 [Sphingobium limneticum]
MKRLLDALFSVTHITIFFIAVWVGMAFMAGEAFGVLRPDYKRLLFVMILAYWAGVALELGFLGRRRARR